MPQEEANKGNFSLNEIPKMVNDAGNDFPIRRDCNRRRRGWERGGLAIGEGWEADFVVGTI
jgi:hypothetical protein